MIVRFHLLSHIVVLVSYLDRGRTLAVLGIYEVHASAELRLLSLVLVEVVLAKNIGERTILHRALI